MNKKRLVFITLLIVVLAVIFGVGYKKIQPMYKDIQAGKKPHYEVGEHQGAEFCGGCHQEIYHQWSKNSAHAVATKNKPFLNFKDKFTNIYAYNLMMGESMCYACHGSKEVNEGVNCETCHGLLIPNTSIEETHEKKYKPGRERLRRPEFCSGCHTMASLLTGDLILSLYSEWQGSEAARKGITCQGCHMEPRGGEFHYHGFDSVSHNVGIYRDDIILKDIKLDFPQFSLMIVNRVIGHAIPAVGPSRVLALEISLLNSDGVEAYKIIKTFAKYYELMPFMGLMPNKLIENTQLQSGEARPLSFTLPSSLKDQISRAVLTLRFYDVSDDHQGDIKKAHWVSKPILEKEISF